MEAESEVSESSSEVVLFLGRSAVVSVASASACIVLAVGELCLHGLIGSVVEGSSFRGGSTMGEGFEMASKGGEERGVPASRLWVEYTGVYCELVTSAHSFRYLSTSFA